MISERTKSALQAAKARGKVLGNPRLAEASAKGRAVTVSTALRFAENMMPVIREIRAAGATSNAAIAEKLNERRIPTARGGKWAHVQVGAILNRMAGLL
jgi:DNA invertase Pin-like site-specific DNA recombinase